MSDVSPYGATVVRDVQGALRSAQLGYVARHGTTKRRGPDHDRERDSYIYREVHSDD